MATREGAGLPESATEPANKKRGLPTTQQKALFRVAGVLRQAIIESERAPKPNTRANGKAPAMDYRRAFKAPGIACQTCFNHA